MEIGVATLKQNIPVFHFTKASATGVGALSWSVIIKQINDSPGHSEQFILEASDESHELIHNGCPESTSSAEFAHITAAWFENVPELSTRKRSAVVGVCLVGHSFVI